MAHNMPDLRNLPLERFCNYVWHMLTRHGSEADIRKLRAKLWRPPVGERVTQTQSPWHPAQETAALASLKASLGLNAKG